MALEEKALEAKAWTAIILALLILSLPFGPTWSMPFLILSGLIVSAVFVVLKKMSGNLAPAADSSATDKYDDLEAPPLPDDTTGNLESSSSSSSSSRFKYDVYLNFRGVDTHHGIADYLDRQLAKEGIMVFNDERDLTPEKAIGLEIKEAIERTRISIVIFTKTFVSSIWCLSALEYMWECRKLNGQIIIPIFYGVNPDDVGLWTALFQDDLSNIEQCIKFDEHGICGIDPDTIKRWTEVLRQTSELKGFIEENTEGFVKQLVEEVVASVVQLLKDDKPVGIDHDVQQMMKKLGVAFREGQATEVRGEEVRVIAICGEWGVGKTTVARAVFNKVYKLFGAHCFLGDIRSEGVQHSRQMLIADLRRQIPAPQESPGEEAEEIASLCCDAKVLIVLDGVDKDEQIKALAGKLTWFGPGSRIIVTTMKKNVSKAFDDVGAVEEYTVKRMDQRRAHKLFCKHAFQGDAAQDVSEYIGLSLDIAKAIGGLPSEIVHQASSLREDMDMTRWKTTLDILLKTPKK